MPHPNESPGSERIRDFLYQQRALRSITTGDPIKENGYGLTDPTQRSSND